MKTLAEQHQEIVAKYRAAGNKWPATAKEIAAWAIKKQEWIPSPASILAQCAEAIAGAMRDELILDRQGRLVRAKHAAKLGPKQETLWADIRTAKREHMEIAFQQRRQQIVGDCRQLKTDVDSYNENASPNNPIQLVLDFRADVAEAEVQRARGQRPKVGTVR